MPEIKSNPIRSPLINKLVEPSPEIRLSTTPVFVSPVLGIGVLRFSPHQTDALIEFANLQKLFKI